MIKAVLFDLWDTLTYHDADVVKKGEEEITALLKSFKLTVELSDYRAIRKKYHTDLTTGKLSSLEFFSKVANELGAPEQTAGQLNEIYGKSFQENIIVFDGVKGLLSKLKAEGFKIGLVTNCGENTMDYLSRLGLDVFDAYALSNEVGVRKPDPKIYMKVVEELDVKPEECAFVSDEIDEDLVGARKLGMKTVYVKQVKRREGSVFDVDPDEKVIEPDFEIANIKDVFDVIRRI
jgi:putative hydrolase of the HAD superfamily